MTFPVHERRAVGVAPNVVWDTNTLSWVRMTQPGSTPGSSDGLTDAELRASDVKVSLDGEVVSVAQESAAMALRLEEAGAVTYVGEADPGTEEDEALWRIKKIDETSGTSVTYAGDATFGYRWDQRDSLVYS